MADARSLTQVARRGLRTQMWVCIGPFAATLSRLIGASYRAPFGLVRGINFLVGGKKPTIPHHDKLHGKYFCLFHTQLARVRFFSRHETNL